MQTPLALFCAVAVLVGCTSASRDTGTVATRDSTARDSVARDSGSTEPSGSTLGSTGDPLEDDSAALCARRGVVIAGVVENSELGEASGLVASRTHPGALWSHNDGGDGDRLFGIGDDGRDLGVHELAGIDATDVEDVAIAKGTTGDDILLADIGDNELSRSSIRIYRFREPDPAAPAPIEWIEILEFVYPDRPHNAETLLVDDASNRVVIVTKEQRLDDGQPDAFGRTEPSFIFEGALDGHGDAPVELVPAGTIDTIGLELLNDQPNLHPAGLLGFGGVPTGGDVSADGSRVALRTYEALWLWPRRPAQSVAEALASEPCQVATANERQGEAVGFVDGALMTLGEGVNQPLHELGR